MFYRKRSRPYTIRQMGRRGCQVVGPAGRRYSRRPIACRRAAAQARLLRAVEHGWRQRKRLTRSVPAKRRVTRRRMR